MNSSVAAWNARPISVGLVAKHFDQVEDSASRSGNVGLFFRVTDQAADEIIDRSGEVGLAVAARGVATTGQSTEATFQLVEHVLPARQADAWMAKRARHTNFQRSLHQTTEQLNP